MKNLAKKLVISMAFVAAAAWSQAASAADAGAVKNDVFSITLPAGFEPFAAQTQTSGPAGKQIQTTNWVSKSPTGEAVVVTMSKMSGRILEPEKLMASTRDSLLKTLKATLDSEEKREGDLPAARLLFHSDAAFFRSRFVVDNDRFLQLLYVGRSADQRAAAPVGQMFDSFQLMAAPQAAAAPASAPQVTQASAAQSH